MTVLYVCKSISFLNKFFITFLRFHIYRISYIHLSWHLSLMKDYDGSFYVLNWLGHRVLRYLVKHYSGMSRRMFLDEARLNLQTKEHRAASQWWFNKSDEGLIRTKMPSKWAFFFLSSCLKLEVELELTWDSHHKIPGSPAALQTLQYGCQAPWLCKLIHTYRNQSVSTTLFLWRAQKIKGNPDQQIFEGAGKAPKIFCKLFLWVLAYVYFSGWNPSFSQDSKRIFSFNKAEEQGDFFSLKFYQGHETYVFWHFTLSL